MSGLLNSTYIFGEFLDHDSLFSDLSHFVSTFIKEHEDDIIDVKLEILWR